MYNWEFEGVDLPKKGVGNKKKVVKKKSADSADGTMDTVEGDDNIIYFYSSVGMKENFKLNKEISTIGRQMEMVAVKLGMDTPPPIHLHINSYGGSVFAGFSSIDYIMKSKTPVYTYIDGCAASAGTLMSVCGVKRFIGENAYMLVHQLSSGLFGKFQEMEDDMKNSQSLMARIKEIYETKTKIPKTKMDALLKHDLWWDAKTCLKYGLVDEILT
jgi:ATP-dependent protease ClpP protease subunit|tara:strand:- start:80 stop:724 length:645 start_codon:yes stop_codon:yes gene_type:complete